ncbi:MAG: recombination regulator RecX [Candidatus Omnitrophica bacterium]|nr:recombination regulator RecX [Candidatus Omnitrophota bacterium]
MNNPLKEELQKAINYAFLLLKYRLRTESEIRRRLKRKKFAADVIEATVSFLKEKKFINDADFARAWFEARGQKFGLKRIRQELRQKGVSAELINQAQNGLRDYQEKEVLFALAKKRMPLLRGLPFAKKRQRLYGYLLRRGFPPDMVLEALNRILPAT